MRHNHLWNRENHGTLVATRVGSSRGTFARLAHRTPFSVVGGCNGGVTHSNTGIVCCPRRAPLLCHPCDLHPSPRFSGFVPRPDPSPLPRHRHHRDLRSLPHTGGRYRRVLGPTTGREDLIPSRVPRLRPGENRLRSEYLQSTERDILLLRLYQTESPIDTNLVHTFRGQYRRRKRTAVQK